MGVRNYFKELKMNLSRTGQGKKVKKFLIKKDGQLASTGQKIGGTGTGVGVKKGVKKGAKKREGSVKRK
eukprot:NODE_183_length_2257_cov_102.688859_g156_i0.p4 GENE.NODE_183_length_2257_cov_102.688859_g156_i0~~NODE_183_length_2257_cov_102.688859_g156_i0.p4  ORF type:complete len:69 (-),score=16.68 NODE_183_length_2257_cov_102.688859_g156_i0:28-234(-)